jgi:hypothetical protein
MKTIPLALCLLGCVRLHAATPTAEDVLAQARKALGGAARLTAVKSLTATGTYRRTPGPGMRIGVIGGPAGAPAVMSGDMEVSLLLPDCYLKSESIGAGEATALEGLDRGKAWTDTRSGPGAGVFVFRRATGGADSPDVRFRHAAARYLLAWTLDAPGAQFTYAGEAEAPDGKADVLDVAGPDGFAVRLFIDRESHLPLMMTYKTRIATGGPVRIEIAEGGPHPDPAELRARLEKAPPPPTREAEMQLRFAEYRQTGAIEFPMLMTWSVDGAVTEEFEVKKFAVNPNLTPDRFRKN